MLTHKLSRMHDYRQNSLVPTHFYEHLEQLRLCGRKKLLKMLIYTTYSKIIEIGEVAVLENNYQLKYYYYKHKVSVKKRHNFWDARHSIIYKLHECFSLYIITFDRSNYNLNHYRGWR